MLEMKVTVAGIKGLNQMLTKEKQKSEKALVTAMKVEGYRLGRVFRTELRAGAPGGKRLTPLSMMRSAMRGRRNTPLSGLVRFQRYYYDAQNKSVHVGWTGPKLKARIKEIAAAAQAGGTRTVTAAQRSYFAFKGGEMGRKMLKSTFRGKIKPGAFKSYKNRGPKYFFLRRQTQTMRSPARQVIKPFWSAHQEEAARNIARDWQRKLRGERI